jgi:ATP-dependent Clp protease ATP-binding subunit ClpC
MKPASLSLAGTRMDRIETLRRTFFGNLALLLEAVIFIAILLGILAAEYEVAFIEGAVLFVFTLGVLHRFIHDADRREVQHSSDATEILDSDLLRGIRHSGSVTAKDLFHASLRSPRGMFLLQELGIDAVHFSSLCSSAVESMDPRAILVGASASLSKHQAKRIAAPHILAFLLQSSTGPFHDVMNHADIAEADLDAVVIWESMLHHSRHASGWSAEAMTKSFGGMGRSWVMGYNNILDELTEDLTSEALRMADRGSPLHGKEIETLAGILTRSAHHNALLLGRRGCGRWTLLMQYACALRTKELAAGLPLSRVLLLKTQRLLSGTDHPDHDLLKALSGRDSGRHIIVIRDLSLLLSGGDARLQGVLMKLLESPNVGVVAIADPEDYHAGIARHSGVNALFERIAIEELTDAETMQVLMEEYSELQKSTPIALPYRLLKKITEATGRYIGSQAFPGKAVEVLREVIAQARTMRPRVVTEEMVSQAVSVRAHQDVSALDTDDRLQYLEIEVHLRERIIGQNHALKTLANALKRGKLQMGSRNRPIGTFLLLGPTGVGKTETAKVLSDILFGGSDQMIRLDMNEFSESTSVAQIIGGGSGEKGVLTRQVQQQPSSLILLDELEKAHPHVLNLFLQILDEGHLIDSDGVKTDFRSTVIIATSNAGSASVHQILQSNPAMVAEEFHTQLINTIIAAGTYSPEFLNRFDEVIVFRPLAFGDSVNVAMQMIGTLASAMQKEKGIALRIDADAVEAIAKKGYSAEFGARAMRRAVQDTLETHLADRFLRQPPKRGEVITVTRADLHI